MLVTTVAKSPQTPRAVATHPGMTTLIVVAKALVPLVLGVAFVFLGTVVTEAALSGVNPSWTILQGFGVISLVLGISFLIVFLGFRRQAADLNLLGSSTALALIVAVEFLIGAWLAFVGVSNFDPAAGSEGLPWSLATDTILGLLLVTDSVLLYRREFKQGGRKSTGA